MNRKRTIAEWACAEGLARHSRSLGCGDLHIRTVSSSSQCLVFHVAVSLWMGPHKIIYGMGWKMKELKSPAGTHMKLLLESRSASTNSVCFSASLWIFISGVKKNLPSCSEVIHAENRILYLVDEPPIYLPILELLLFPMWVSVLNWTTVHCAPY